MSDAETVNQQRVHEVLEDVLRDNGDLPEGQVLVGWLVSFETASYVSGSRPCAGHFYGPREMTSWRAMGLNEWTRGTLGPDDEDDD